MPARWAAAWVVAVALGCALAGWLGLVLTVNAALTPVRAIAHLIGA